MQNAFRFFDGDHMLSLTLNEFAQGIEHLRIKISFDDVKKVFNFLDHDQDGHINFHEFKLLDEENYRKIDTMGRYYEISKKVKEREHKRNSQPDEISEPKSE